MSDAPEYRCIIHADLDAFYASVEMREDPSLVARPVLVGGSPEDRGVVAACSYEARRFGIHSAMPMRTALARCPHAVIVHPRFDLYRRVSAEVMEVFRAITPIVQPVSLDEAYLDVTTRAAQEAPDEIARGLKEQVKSRVELTISVGVASSKSVAKIASEMDKPDGLVVVEPGSERGFLAPLPVRKLPGIGPKADILLREHGITTADDLAGRDYGELGRLLGKRGPELGRMAKGEDDSPVVTERIAKSVSAENTFSEDLSDPAAIVEEVQRLSRRVAKHLQNAGLRGRTVTLKLRLSDFTTLTRSQTGATGTGDYEPLAEIAVELVKRELGDGRRFRLLGVGVSNFSDVEQLQLF